jgi:adenylate kinase
MPTFDIVLLLGPPGAGKGTQAHFLAGTLGVPHVASGDLLREHRQRGTELGQAAQAFMDSGDLVPDELVIDMIAERLSRPDADRGALLDGFPRTRRQAQALDSRLDERGRAVRAALYLDVPREVPIERLAGRWLCRICGATYHVRLSPSIASGVCPACGGELYQRPDDRPEVVEKRIDVYLRETLPVIEHYAARGQLRRINGDRVVEAVRAELCAALGGAVRGWRRDDWHLFVEHGFSPSDAGELRVSGRTLCGKIVVRQRAQELGGVEVFTRQPCRGCRHALHARRRPALEPPTTRVPRADAQHGGQRG